jgi:hypothetical protein
MFRFAWAYQGSGSITYLAGGATLDVAIGNQTLDLADSSAVDLASSGALDISLNRKALEISDDGNSIDL